VSNVILTSLMIMELPLLMLRARRRL